MPGQIQFSRPATADNSLACGRRIQPELFWSFDVTCVEAAVYVVERDLQLSVAIELGFRNHKASHCCKSPTNFPGNFPVLER